MSALPPWIGVALLLSGAPSTSAPEDQAKARPPAAPGPIAASVERVVDAMQRERAQACRSAVSQGLPCFPVSVELGIEPEYSVAKSLEHLRFDASPAESRPPTHGELRASQPWAIASTAGGGDPVCAAKALIKGLKGAPDVYYLYWVTDRTGVRPILIDHPLEPAAYETVAELHYELVEKIKGQCKAIAAYRRAERELAGQRTHTTPAAEEPKSRSNPAAP